MEYTVLPVTTARFGDLEQLLAASVVASRCFCAYWSAGAAYRANPPRQNRDALEREVAQERPPGLLAYANEVPVGWCRVGPRGSTPALESLWRLRGTDGGAPWAITCLFVRPGDRRTGATRALIAAAVELARRAGADAVDAFPVDAAVSPSASSTGFASTFVALGFREVARRHPSRPILRLELRSGDGAR